jgi:hypothetical protein
VQVLTDSQAFEQEPARDDIEDCVNSEWLRHVQPVPIADEEDKQLENYKPNNISTYRNNLALF